MSDSHKKMMQELDLLIAKVPDVDMDVAFGEFLKKYENEMKKSHEYVEGLVPRLVFIADFIRFQFNIVLGGKLDTSLKSLLVWADAMKHHDIGTHLSDKQRMQKMAEILQKKAQALHHRPEPMRKAS